MIAVCAVVVIWNPRKAKQESAVSNSSAIETSDELTSSILSAGINSASSDSIVSDSSSNIESSTSTESSFGVTPESSITPDLVPEDQPDSPNLNFETSGSSYDDIMVNVLTCILSEDTAALSTYVGSQGLRLSPTGYAVEDDVVLSSTELADYFSMGSQSYGIYPGSGESIYCSPSEYYHQYILPSGFDFTLSTVSYNDNADLAAAGNWVDDPKTVSYHYAPNVMGWKRIILVYGSEGSGDVLCGIIYQDLTTK